MSSRVGPATISGGGNNQASGDAASVGGGSGNSAGGSEAIVGGGCATAPRESFCYHRRGVDNTASGVGATVGGGGGNTANRQLCHDRRGRRQPGQRRVCDVPGGTFNLAQGSYSLAAGRHAKAYNQGCFVWGDYSTDTDVACNEQQPLGGPREWWGLFLHQQRPQQRGVRAGGRQRLVVVSDRNLKENVGRGG